VIVSLTTVYVVVNDSFGSFTRVVTLALGELDLATRNQKSQIVLGTDGLASQRAVRITVLSSHNRRIIYTLAPLSLLTVYTVPFFLYYSFALLVAASVVIPIVECLPVGFIQQ
jgi:hypothetical protein